MVFGKSGGKTVGGWVSMWGNKWRLNYYLKKKVKSEAYIVTCFLNQRNGFDGLKTR